MDVQVSFDIEPVAKAVLLSVVYWVVSATYTLTIDGSTHRYRFAVWMQILILLVTVCMTSLTVVIKRNQAATSTGQAV